MLGFDPHSPKLLWFLRVGKSCGLELVQGLNPLMCAEFLLGKGKHSLPFWGDQMSSVFKRYSNE